MDEDTKHQFQAVVWDYYHQHGRHALPWRIPDDNGKFDPYRIMVSEIMLQQTQVGRVIPKYAEFLERFPTIDDLARAELGDVLRVWSGLGYNRRAKYLWQAAKVASREEFPATVNELTKLPGIGLNTAGAIAAYAFNQQVAFVETNVRTVYIHHFFNDQQDVNDTQLLPFIRNTVDQEHPREWYWALMDYGTYLKQTVGNLNKLSAHYSKQSTFQGSRRQIRGAVLRLLHEGSQTGEALQSQLPDARLADVLSDLVTEGLVVQKNNQYLL
jgi:A/G-specific adenine glycosylase